MLAKPAIGGKWDARFYPAVLVGMLNSSSEAVVVTDQGSAVKTHAANARRISESERRDADRILGMRAVPWSPHGSDNAFDIQVGMERHGRGFDGEQSSEDVPSQSRRRSVGSQ